jgi:hypothetical protein
MNTHSPKHLITELGVLKTFSIGKRLSADKINAYKSKIKKITKTKKEADLLLKQVIQKDAQKMAESDVVPGIVVDKTSDKRLEAEKKLVELTYFASIINKKVSEKKMEKFDKCYLINVLVNMLGLSEEDFDNFHQIFNKFKSGEIESPMDGDDTSLI